MNDNAKLLANSKQTFISGKIQTITNNVKWCSVSVIFKQKFIKTML